MLQKYLYGMLNLFAGTLGLVGTGSKLIKDPPVK